MILVVGGTGFVGAVVVRELVRRGEKVAVLTRAASRQTDRFPGLGVEYREGDVRRPETLATAMAGIDAVIGSQTFPNLPVENPAKGHTWEEIDARGTENLVAAAKQAGVTRYVYISGAGAAPDAPQHWFRSKWRAEEAVRNSGLAYTILRPSWVYGPEDKALNRFMGMARFLPFVPLIGNPSKQRLQPVFVEDVAKAAAESFTNPAAENETFEIGGPEALTMREIVRTALAVSGRRRLVLAAPKSVVKTFASVLKRVPGRPFTPDAVEFVTMDALADSSRLEDALGLRMTPLREGLATYMGRR